MWHALARLFDAMGRACVFARDWCEPSAHHLVLVPKDAVYQRAIALMCAAEVRAGVGTSGVYKRWEMVYPQLVKEFPSVAHAAINRAIEAAVSLKSR